MSANYELTPHIRAVRAANARKAAAVANSPSGLVGRVEKISGQLTNDLKMRLLILTGVLTADGQLDTEALCQVLPAKER